MKKIILIIGCLALSVMLLFIFLASLGGLFAEDKQLGTAISLLAVSVFGFLLVFAVAKKHIFSHEDSKTTHQSENENTANNEKLYTYEDIVRREVMASDLFEDMYKEKIIEYQLQFESLHMKSPEFIPIGDDSDILSLDEKKELGLNTRAKYQKYLVFLLTDKGLHYQNNNPKEILMFAVNKASNIISLQKEIARSQKLGITKMKVSPIGDQRDCEWCLSMKNKVVPLNLEFIDEVLDNCACEYPRIVIMPEIKF